MLAAQMSLFNETEWNKSRKVGAQGGAEATRLSNVEVTPDPARRFQIFIRAVIILQPIRC